MEKVAYSPIDRLMHRLAFGHSAVQNVLSDIEANLYGHLWREQPLRKPIFITSLPRAGTTLLLNILGNHPQIATHVYRDMPFVRAPVLWKNLSWRFRKVQPETERAHGDGLMINPDSAEAFEEILWLTRFSAHYRSESIALWRTPAPEFQTELADHMRRIVYLRMGKINLEARYLSKNNANIARIGILQAAFPDAQILVPLRDPLAQAVSMHHQHMHFAERHARDRFARQYMADIGHFEFGALHRPILFDGIDDLQRRYSPNQLSYWIKYWTAAYRHLAAKEGLTFIDHAGFCRDTQENFTQLCSCLGLEPERNTVRYAIKLVQPKVCSPNVGTDLEGLEEARDLYAQLQASSLFADIGG